MKNYSGSNFSRSGKSKSGKSGGDSGDVFKRFAGEHPHLSKLAGDPFFQESYKTMAKNLGISTESILKSAGESIASKYEGLSPDEIGKRALENHLSYKRQAGENIDSLPVSMATAYKTAKEREKELANNELMSYNERAGNNNTSSGNGILRRAEETAKAGNTASAENYVDSRPDPSRPWSRLDFMLYGAPPLGFISAQLGANHPSQTHHHHERPLSGQMNSHTHPVNGHHLFPEGYKDGMDAVWNGTGYGQAGGKGYDLSNIIGAATSISQNTGGILNDQIQQNMQQPDGYPYQDLPPHPLQNPYEIYTDEELALVNQILYDYAGYLPPETQNINIPVNYFQNNPYGFIGQNVGDSVQNQPYQPNQFYPGYADMNQTVLNQGSGQNGYDSAPEESYENPWQNYPQSYPAGQITPENIQEIENYPQNYPSVPYQQSGFEQMQNSDYFDMQNSGFSGLQQAENTLPGLGGYSELMQGQQQGQGMDLFQPQNGNESGNLLRQSIFNSVNSAGLNLSDSQPISSLNIGNAVQNAITNQAGGQNQTTETGWTNLFDKERQDKESGTDWSQLFNSNNGEISSLIENMGLTGFPFFPKTDVPILTKTDISIQHKASTGQIPKELGKFWPQDPKDIPQIPASCPKDQEFIDIAKAYKAIFDYKNYKVPEGVCENYAICNYYYINKMLDPSVSI